MAKEVSLTIDGIRVTVPAGTLIVDAAKKVGIDIPVFCYHPKMEPVGMCRMCLVDVGRPAVDRTTNQFILDAEGNPKITFAPKLETACTTPVSEGMVVVGASPKVAAARKEILEFILTSHPLDCPVCDKGGECPLQNLTMGFGPGESRFEFSEKMHLAKKVPLGELITLDRERCIQCARCVRFQSDIAGDPVIGFDNRGRSLEIITSSEPGFDSYFSGNTTDICPVGALTTVDFRFGARAWEMIGAATICTHCAVGCNMTMNVRREAGAGGKLVIKRGMPRQNEAVNEIWVCDKGRFGYSFAESRERLTQPLVRKNGELVSASWDEALEKAGQALIAAGSGFYALAGGRLANEDLYTLARLARERGGSARLYSSMAGGELVSRFGMNVNLGDLGKGAVILVAASDLHEEAPVWYLRLRAAARRGAKLIVLGARPTKLDQVAQVIRCEYGEEAEKVRSFINGSDRSFFEAEQAVIFYGGEGLDLAGTQALASACAALLAACAKPGGLVGVWLAPNTQGAWELGYRPSTDLASELGAARLAWIAGADPAGDDPRLAAAVDAAEFVVVQELFLTETARRADVVFPAQSMFEREGTYASGERRVQRFYPVIYPPAGVKTDYGITALAAAKAGVALEQRAASLVFARLAEDIPAFRNMTYAGLSAVSEQWPIVGRGDLYFGGTGYENKQGLGIRLAVSTVDETPAQYEGSAAKPALGEIALVPVTRLYDDGQLMQATKLLDRRKAQASVRMHPRTIGTLGLNPGALVEFSLSGQAFSLPIVEDESAPQGVGLIPRSTGVPLSTPAVVRVLKAAESIEGQATA